MILSYTGSKKSLVENLDKVILPIIDKVYKCTGKPISFGDLFAGTGFVSDHYKNNRLIGRVVTSDLELYSYVLNKALMQTVYTPRIAKVIDVLNSSNKCKPAKGLIFQHYSPNSQCERMYFTNGNAQRIDAIRLALNQMYKHKRINYREFIFLLGSLMTSVSRYANTAGTFRAYLKAYCPRAERKFILSPIHRQVSQKTAHIVKKNDAINVAASGTRLDVVYLDPPYNTNHYGAYYGFYNYLCLYHPQVPIQGVAGVMKNYNKSYFGFSASAALAFQKLFHNLKFKSKTKYIVMSYNNNGSLQLRSIVNIMIKFGDVKTYKLLHKNYRPHNRIKMNHVTEYIFVIDLTSQTNSYKEEWLKF